MQTLSHNDTPTDTDGLSQQDFIDGIAGIIKDCTPPKGIAINGYWGTGKTSSLLQLYKALTTVSRGSKIPKESPVIPVWFEAWRYQHEALPIVALLYEIRSTFNLWNKVLEQSGKVAAITALGVLGAFDETIKAASGGVASPKLGKLSKIGANYEQQRYQNPLASQDISQLLEQAIATALGNKPKLVIFIDDLDRCHPEAALKLLEGIKVYLNLKNCVIVFAIDQRQIERGLKKALDLNDGSDGHQAREYLEKICQDIYHLPLPKQADKADYLASLLTDITADQAHIAGIKTVAESYDCLPANPRKIKALANRLAVVLRHQLALTEPRHYQLLVATAIIYTFHRELIEQLEKDAGYINTVILYARQPPADMGGIYEPMKSIKPSYSGTDKLPTNPSDSHVFRLHELFINLGTVLAAELQPFLGR
ncbi:MAG: P-loop NTPase fold protein [Methylococcales bacterium]|nr:P-loop NTPase fold protein [Methylococcales bacterium]